MYLGRNYFILYYKYKLTMNTGATKEYFNIEILGGILYYTICIIVYCIRLDK